MAKRDDASPQGERAQAPQKLPPRAWTGVLTSAVKETSADNIPLVAAGVAFYLLLSLFPMLIAAISIFGLVVDPAELERSMSELFTALPEAARGVVESQLHHIASAAGTGLRLGLVVSVAVALWTASSGMSNLMKALSLAYDQRPRGFLKGRALALGLTLGGVLLLGVALAIIIGAPLLYRALALPSGALVIAQAAQWLLLGALFIGALGVLYHFGPNVEEPTWSWVSPGALLATALLLVISVGFSFYVSQFGSYNETYGAIGGVIVLLLWLYFAAFAVLIGAEVNANAERMAHALRDARSSQVA